MPVENLILIVGKIMHDMYSNKLFFFKNKFFSVNTTDHSLENQCYIGFREFPRRWIVKCDCHQGGNGPAGNRFCPALKEAEEYIKWTTKAAFPAIFLFTDMSTEILNFKDSIIWWFRCVVSSWHKFLNHGLLE